MSHEDSEMNFVGFRVGDDLDDDLDDLAWANRMSKSELLRQFCKHGVEHADEILDESDGDPDDRSENPNN